MHDEQYKRYRKMHSDTIELLIKKASSKKDLYFLVKGNSGENYKVVIRRNGDVDCSCPDQKNGAKNNECICKHCLFVIFEVLKFTTDIDHTFFRRLRFTPDEMQRIYSLFKKLSQK